MSIMRRLKKTMTKKIIALFAVFSVLISLPFQMLHSEELPSQESRLNKEFLLKFGNDFKDVVLAPRDWDGMDVLNLAVIFGTGTILYTLDQDIIDWFKNNKTSTSSDFFGFMTNLGDGGYLTAIIAALYASGELSRQSRLRKAALLSLESLATTSVFVLGMKFMAGRARPQAGEGSQSFHPFSIKSRYMSFPSGHSASIFAVATSIADQIDNTPVDILAYSLAALVTLSRVHQDEHWASDAFVGSAFGYFIAKRISSLNRPAKAQKWQISFAFTPEKKAITFYLAF